MDYSENGITGSKLYLTQDIFTGDLERLRRFWLTGTCNPKKEEKRSSEPLAPEQFLSAFFLLMCGVLLAAALCSMEHLYCKYVKKSVNKTDQAGCCALVSLVRIFKQLMGSSRVSVLLQSVGKSLTFRGTVFEASELMKNHKCSDPVCDGQLLKVSQSSVDVGFEAVCATGPSRARCR